MEEKKKEPFFFMDLELLNLDDYNVPNMKLHCNSNDMDDDDAPKPEGMDVGDGNSSSSHCLEPNFGLVVEPVPSVVPAHYEHPPKAILSIFDPLFNVAGKAPHPDVVIMK